MEQTKNLDQLFEEWSGAVDNLSRDGIVNEGRYDNSHPKTLFVRKEPNQHERDLRLDAEDAAKKIADRKTCGFATWDNLARWSYGILHQFPSYTESFSTKGPTPQQALRLRGGYEERQAPTRRR